MGYGTSAELVIGFGLTDSQKGGSCILINMLQIVESKEDSVQSIIIELNIFKRFTVFYISTFCRHLLNI